MLCDWNNIWGFERWFGNNIFSSPESPRITFTRELSILLSTIWKPHPTCFWIVYHEDFDLEASNSLKYLHKKPLNNNSAWTVLHFLQYVEQVELSRLSWQMVCPRPKKQGNVTRAVMFAQTVAAWDDIENSSVFLMAAVNKSYSSTFWL